MTFADFVQVGLLLVGLLTIHLQRRTDNRKRDADRESRALADLAQHQNTREQIRSLTHALELRVQDTEKVMERHVVQIDRMEVRMNTVEKDIIEVKANVRTNR